MVLRFHISTCPVGFLKNRIFSVYPPADENNMSVTESGGTCVRFCGWPWYLVWAGGLVNSACVFIVLLRLGLVRHTVGLVHGSHVVHQGNGLHCLVNSAADGLADLGGCWSPGGWKVMAGLNTITESTVIKRRARRNLKRVTTFFKRESFIVDKVFLREGSYCSQ